MALSGVITVTPAELKAQASIVSKQVGQMEKAFEDLQRKMNSSSSYWKGDAGNHYRDQYKAKIGIIQEKLQSYKKHVRDLEEMAGVYEEGERQAREIANTLPVSTL